MKNQPTRARWKKAALGVAVSVWVGVSQAQTSPAPAHPPVPVPPENTQDPTVPSPQLDGVLNVTQERAVGLPTGVSRVELATRTADAVAPEKRIVASAEFSDVTFADAARELSLKTGINIAASSAANSVRVELHMRNLAVEDVLETLCNANGLWYRKDPRTGVLWVFTVSEFRQDLVSFRDEKTEVFTLLYPNVFDIAHALQDLFGDRLIVSFEADDTEMTDDLQQRFERFDLVDNRSEGLGNISSSSSGGSSSSYGSSYSSSRSSSRQSRSYSGGQRRSDSAFATGASAGLGADQIQSLQKEPAGGAPSPQDQSDAARKIMEHRVMINVSVLRRQNKLLVRTADEQALDEIRKLVTQLDVPTSLVLLEVKVLSIELGNDFTSAFDAIFAKSETSGSFSSGTILEPASTTKPVGLADGTGLTSDNLIFQYIGNNFSARIQMLETKNRVTQLATPILLTANNEVSRVFIGEEYPINRSYSGGQVITTGTTSSTTSSSTDIEFVPVGTALLITPSINADRTVTLRVLQENSTINSKGATILIPSGSGYEQQQVDIVQSRKVSGTFVAKDRLAVAVGGLIGEKVQNNSTGVPVLSSIPWVGQLFRRDAKDRTRSEMVVIIRPYILNTPAEAERVSRDLMKQLSIHPSAASLRGTLNAYGTNDVPRAEDTAPFARPR